jgi:hypothetical protein
MRSGARLLQSPTGTSGSERHRDASCIAQAFRLPRLPTARSEGWSDSRWQGSRNYMGVFKSSVKNAGIPRENTEKLAGLRVAIEEQLDGRDNVCGGCNWVAILGGIAGHGLVGAGFSGSGRSREAVFERFGGGSARSYRPMIARACTDTGRSDCAANPSSS